jgi:hypothetical protein
MQKRNPPQVRRVGTGKVLLYPHASARVQQIADGVERMGMQLVGYAAAKIQSNSG